MGINTVEKSSDILSNSSKLELPKFEFNELLADRIIGRGSFCIINEISNFKLCVSDPSNRSRSYIANSCRFDNYPRYVVKKLRTDLDDESLKKGAQDLALEANILANLDHPNIINLRAVSSADPLSANYFLILDRLYNTLDTQCKLWAMKMRVDNRISNLIIFKKGNATNLLLERLTVAHSIAMALDHMHSQRIMHRDLAPYNIGFDIEGKVKLFDFGLAKVLDPSKELEDGNYKLTGFTGSLRFMAPEIAKCQPYNFSADVFSFGVLLWYIMSCAIPYQSFTVQMYMKDVVKSGYRPKMKKGWTKDIKKVIDKCWSSDSRERPNMSKILPSLKKCIMELD